MKRPLRHMVVVIPGITGSVLERDGKDVWGSSGQALWNALASRGADLRALALTGDDDGVAATRLMPRVHVVPGLVRIDGYERLIDMIAETFAIVRDDRGHASNFVEFPYDWRRDNRVNAQRLGALVDEILPVWRERSGADDAQVVVVAHSMGGLLARYWIECLGGWRQCRALMTLGTPYRGAPNALGYLANGYKRLGVDLTQAMRTFPSVHQLLPRYPMVDAAGLTSRVAETPGIDGVDGRLACDGLAFHREIDAAVAANDAEHGRDRYALLPFAGTRQSTAQSAVLTDGRLTLSDALPDGVDALLADGDGTVPRVSATPVELSESFRDTFVVERHSSLQANAHVLVDLCERLAQLQVRGLAAVRGPGGGRAAEESRPALAINVADAFVDGEPIVVEARFDGSEVQLGRPQARIEPLTALAAPVVRPFAPSPDGGWRLEAEGLPDGLHRLTVSVEGGGPWAPSPVHDVFGVVGGAVA